MIKSNDIKFTSSLFSGGEIHIQIEELTLDMLDINLTINNSHDLIEYLLLDNAMYHYSNQFRTIWLNIDYLPYARQDRVCAKGQAFSLEMIAGLLNNLKCTTYIECQDLHSLVPHKLIKNINEIDQVSQILINNIDTVLSDINLIISPDKGALEKTKEIHKEFPVTLCFAEKIRDPKTGEITETIIHASDEEIKGKTCFIPDDICDGGKTFIEIAKILKERGAKKIILYITHGIFSKGLNVFDDLIDEIYCYHLVNKTILQLDIKNYKVYFHLIKEEA